MLYCNKYKTIFFKFRNVQILFRKFLFSFQISDAYCKNCTFFTIKNIIKQKKIMKNLFILLIGFILQEQLINLKKIVCQVG